MNKKTNYAGYGPPSRTKVQKDGSEIIYIKHKKILKKARRLSRRIECKNKAKYIKRTCEFWDYLIETFDLDPEKAWSFNPVIGNISVSPNE